MKKIISIFFIVLLAGAVAWGADKVKVSELTELAVTPADSDEFVINDGGTTKKVAYSTIMDGEALQDDSVDDDAIDFSDVTCADLTVSDCGEITSSPSVLGGSSHSVSRDFKSQAFDNGETQTTVTAAHMLGAKWLTDQGGSAETDVILTAVSYYIQNTIAETEGNGWEICPPSGEALYLDGTAIAADDCIDGGGNVGDMASLIRMQIADGTYAYFLWTIWGTWSDGNDTGD